MFPLPLNIWFEFAAFIVSIFCYQSIKDKPLRWFIPFLFLILVVEFAGRYLRTELHTVNSWLYNIFIPIEYFFYSYLFYSYTRDAALKKIMKAILWLIIPASLINILFIQGWYNFNTNILLAGNCLMILLSFMFFVDLLRRDEPVYLGRMPMFWIAMGVLLFNMGELSYTLSFNYILKNKHDAKAILFTAINSKLIYVLYTCISIGLLCTKSSQAKPYPTI